MGSASVIDRFPPSRPNIPAKPARVPVLQSQPTAKVTLPNGHRIAYEEFGEPGGYPLFYFHDYGSSRLECAFLHSSAKSHGYRLIAADRPGIGWSDFYANATAESVAVDTILLADALQIERFGVLAVGSGGVFALALAHACPHRVRQFTSLGGVPGSVFRESRASSEVARWMGRWVPSLLKCLVRCRWAMLREHPAQNLQRLMDELSPADRSVLQDPAVRHTLAIDQLEVMRQGSLGLAQDLSNCYRKLGFNLADVSVLTTIWQGRSDSLSQRADCEFMASQMPATHYHRISNAGHFFFINGVDSVFARLRGRERERVTPALAA